MIQRFWKPWFVHQPLQLLRRTMQVFQPATPGYQLLSTSWGASVLADPTKTIGRSVRTTGIYDLTVGEILARLISPGDLIIDAGANIGYMTLLSLASAGPGGRVLSFEPHPDLYPILTSNIDLFRKANAAAESETYPVALGETPGTANLVLPTHFASNDGVAYIQNQATANDRTIAVTVDTLDRILDGRTAAVMKIDVEGFELQVLRGAATTIAGRRIRHIIFEDHDIQKSQVVHLLKAAGYTIHAIGWNMNGPTHQPVEMGALNRSFEPANFVATLDLPELAARTAPRGWRTLRRMTRAASVN